MSADAGEINIAADRLRGTVCSRCSLAALLGLVSIVLVGCGAPAAVAKDSAIAVSLESRGAACEAVAAALADGPDASEDPVGYAEAQVRPLQAITTSSASLRVAIDQLAGAYQRVVRTGAGGSANVAEATAQHLIGSMCPGVAP